MPEQGKRRREPIIEADVSKVHALPYTFLSQVGHRDYSRDRLLGGYLGKPLPASGAGPPPHRVQNERT